MFGNRRRGIALVVVLMTSVVLAIGSTVILVNLTSSRAVDRRLAAQVILTRFGLEVGANGQSPSFDGDVTANPSQLSQLGVKITTSDRDSCGDNYTGGTEVNNWRGPYHLVPMTKDRRYEISPGFSASDTLVRVPTTGGQNDDGTLFVVMKDVALDDAQALNFAFDGNTNGTGPKIFFTPNGNAAIEVRYAIPIKGC